MVTTQAATATDAATVLEVAETETCHSGFYLNNGSCSECTLADITPQSEIMVNVTCNADKLIILFSDEFYQHACLASQNFTVDVRNFCFLIIY